MNDNRKKRIKTEKDGEFQEVSPPLPFLPEDCIFEIAKHSIRMNYDVEMYVEAREWYIWRLVSKSMQKRIDSFYLKEYGQVHCASYKQFKLVPHLVASLTCGFSWNVDDIRAVLNDLKTSKTVELLDFFFVELRDLVKEVVELIETNTSIKNISFNTNKLDGMGTKLIVEALSKNKNITNIGLSYVDIEMDDMEFIVLKLKECKNLTCLRLDGFYRLGDEVAKLLSDHLTNTPLTDFTFTNSEITGVDDLCKMVLSNERITSLGLGMNVIKVQMAKTIFTALEKHKLLDLNMNNICDDEYKALAEIISTYVSKNSTLEQFNINGNFLGDEGIETLSQSLLVNKSITSLNLSDNKFGDKGARSISEYLTSNKSLSSVFLNYNNISTLGASLIAVSLEVNQTLTRLDLRMNNIGDEGGRAIGHTLAKNKSLIYLDLASNDIGDKGIETIAESLTINSTIRFLLLSRNRISYNGAVLLIVSAKNRSLSFLDLAKNEIGEKQIEFIESNQEYRSSLTIHFH